MIYYCNIVINNLGYGDGCVVPRVNIYIIYMCYHRVQCTVYTVHCTVGWITLIHFSILFIGSSIIYSKDMSYNEYI